MPRNLEMLDAVKISPVMSAEALSYSIKEGRKHTSAQRSLSSRTGYSLPSAIDRVYSVASEKAEDLG